MHGFILSNTTLDSRQLVNDPWIWHVCIHVALIGIHGITMFSVRLRSICEQHSHFGSRFEPPAESANYLRTHLPRKWHFENIS